MEQGQNREKQ